MFLPSISQLFPHQENSNVTIAEFGGTRILPVCSNIEREVNVQCGLMKDRAIGPDILKWYVVPQFPAGIIYQQDGALPSTSPDLTPLEFFVWLTSQLIC
ncbi:hypothetical protein C0J52_05481 [Blattella germanica]|nr:hypothetical protein C0J52_05481 [Blattella germanica]